MAAIRTRYGKLCVDFRYLNIRCRETTALEDNAQNRKKLEKAIERMEAEILLGIFDYAKYFPKSSRLKEIKNAYVAHTQAKQLLKVISFMTGAHDTSVPTVEVKKIDLSELTSTLNTLDESQVLLMMQVLQGRLNDLSQDNLQKVA